MTFSFKDYSPNEKQLWLPQSTQLSGGLCHVNQDGLCATLMLKCQVMQVEELQPFNRPSLLSLQVWFSPATEENLNHFDGLMTLRLTSYSGTSFLPLQHQISTHIHSVKSIYTHVYTKNMEPVTCLNNYRDLWLKKWSLDYVLVFCYTSTRLC